MKPRKDGENADGNHAGDGDGAPERDRQGLRERLLEQAIAEFSSVGFAGARVERIASRAGGNKQLIYHYFGSKQGLYDEVIRTMVNRTYRDRQFPETLLEMYRDLMPRRSEYLKWTLLLGWEGLSGRGENISDIEDRQEVFNHMIGIVKNSSFDPSVDADLIVLLVVWMLMSPALLPQLTYAITGQAFDDPAFQARWDGLAEQVLSRLSLQPGGQDGPPRERP